MMIFEKFERFLGLFIANELRCGKMNIYFYICIHSQTSWARYWIVTFNLNFYTSPENTQTESITRPTSYVWSYFENFRKQVHATCQMYNSI